MFKSETLEVLVGEKLGVSLAIHFLPSRSTISQGEEYMAGLVGE